jgi:hypothetical protein
MDGLRKLSRNLTSQPWFSDHWFIIKGLYARGIGFQMAKTHWYNHEGQGVHLETWIDEEVIQKKEIAVVMHVEPELPNRRKFKAAFWKRAKSKIQQWDGYEIREENLMELWKKRLPFVKSKMAEVLASGFEKIRVLGEDIDAVLKEAKDGGSKDRIVSGRISELRNPWIENR